MSLTFKLTGQGSQLREPRICEGPPSLPDFFCVLGCGGVGVCLDERERVREREGGRERENIYMYTYI